MCLTQLLFVCSSVQEEDLDKRLKQELMVALKGISEVMVYAVSHTVSVFSPINYNNTVKQKGRSVYMGRGRAQVQCFFGRLSRPDGCNLL